MTATERIRAMLDERGVEWTVPDESWNQDSITYWKVGSIKWVAFESENDTLWLNCNSVTDLTPEQAIAATLGATDAKPTQVESSGTCHDLVHVVRCRDCKHCMSYWKSDYCDYFSHVTNDPDGFCAWGERKESE